MDTFEKENAIRPWDKRNCAESAALAAGPWERERERERARGKMLGKYSKWHRQLKVGSIEQALREKCQTQVEPASSLHRY